MQTFCTCAKRTASCRCTSIRAALRSWNAIAKLTATAPTFWPDIPQHKCFSQTSVPLQSTRSFIPTVPSLQQLQPLLFFLFSGLSHCSPHEALSRLQHIRFPLLTVLLTSHSFCTVLCGENTPPVPQNRSPDSKFKLQEVGVSKP